MSKSPEDLIRELETGGVLDAAPSAAPIAPRSGQPVMTRRVASSSVVLLVVAAILVAILGSLPFGSLVLYPFSLFVTLIHELGHAFVATLTGGSVDGFRISSDLSGQVVHTGGVEALVAPAGYLGATLAGAALLVTPLRFSRAALGTLAALPLTALIFFHPATTFTELWCLAFSSGLGAAAWKLPTRPLAFLQVLLGGLVGLNAVRDLSTLLFISGSAAHMQTDADNMANALFGPSVFWAVLWTVLAVLILAAALYRMGSSDLRRLRS